MTSKVILTAPVEPAGAGGDRPASVAVAPRHGKDGCKPIPLPQLRGAKVLKIVAPENR